MPMVNGKKFKYDKAGMKAAAKEKAAVAKKKKKKKKVVKKKTGMYR